MPERLQLPHGYHDARYTLVAVAFFGELFQGGLMFGWNALSLILKAQGNYERGCSQSIIDNYKSGLDQQCASQESKLAVLWNIGIFALNFGPVIVGPVLDYIGPKLTAIIGSTLNVTALILLGCSNTHSSFNALRPGVILLGGGGMCFNLAQLHISNLFPRNRGLISSIFLAGFTGSAVIFYFLWLIFKSTAQTMHSYKVMMIVYAMFCFLWIPVNIWMMPWHSLHVGQMYLFSNRGFFKVIARKDLEAQMKEVRMSAQEAKASNKAINGSELKPQNSDVNDVNGDVDGDVALAYLGLGNTSPRPEPDSSDPSWNENEKDEKKLAESSSSSSPNSSQSEKANGNERQGLASQKSGPPQISVIHEGFEDRQVASPWNYDAENPAPQTPHNVVWGPLIFESRRFVELRQKSLWKQITSAESTGMGLFYTLNIVCLQIYLGTTRLQLEHKGDTKHTVTSISNIVPVAGFLYLPIITWLLDSKGYGITMGTINFLGVLASFFQAMPSLWFQVVTLFVWCAARYFLYTSYFSIFGALFGMKNFGKMVAVDNAVNGLVGLLQLPLTNWALHGLKGNFTAINIIQAGVLTPFFYFCYMMYKWERTDLVPIRPMEGEVLPTTMVGPRTLREAKFLKTLEHRLPGTAAGGGEKKNKSQF